MARGSSPAAGDKAIYIVLSLDHSKGRLGEGNPMQRMRDHLGAAISCLAPNAPIRWSTPSSFVDFIVANDFRMPYVVLADGISKADAFAGQQRMFDHFGLGQDSFLINPWRR